MNIDYHQTKPATMDSQKHIQNHFQQSIAVKQAILQNTQLLAEIDAVASACVDAYKHERKLLFAGNGGSAADAQHLAAEFVSRFNFDRPGLPAIALTTDTSMLTAIGNDYGFLQLFARQLQANGREGDLFFAISTSGNSKNVIEAVKQAKLMNIKTIALCGQQGELTRNCDFTLAIPSTCTPYIQESHITVGHCICGIVEQRLFGHL